MGLFHHKKSRQKPQRQQITVSSASHLNTRTSGLDNSQVKMTRNDITYGGHLICNVPVYADATGRPTQNMPDYVANQLPALLRENQDYHHDDYRIDYH